MAFQNFLFLYVPKIPNHKTPASSLLLFWENRSRVRYFSFDFPCLPLWIPLCCTLYSPFRSLAPGWNGSPSGNVILSIFTLDHKPSCLLTSLLFQFPSLIFFLISPDQPSLHLPTQVNPVFKKKQTKISRPCPFPQVSSSYHHFHTQIIRRVVYTCLLHFFTSPLYSF